MNRTLLELTEKQVKQVMGRVEKHETDSKEIAFEGIEHIVHVLKRRIDATLPDRGGNSRDGKRYSFIAAPFQRVACEFLELRSAGVKIRSFLDVGCGIGNIMLIPFSLGISAHGIEYDANVLEYALFPIMKGRTRYHTGIYHMDAFEFKRYSQYDIIYYYCPMCDSKMEKRLEDKIQQEMSPGAYLFAYSGYLRVDSKFTRITDCIWQKRGKKDGR